ncbi:tyrosine/phenylalanine carboxypeptidase domain-containing protein [Patescibacteria group bacterium]
MNARNLRYIRPHNLRRAMRIADSKLLSKKTLDKAGIPTPKMHGFFEHYRQVDDFDWNKLPGNIVLKPNQGFGGEGIVVFSKKQKNKDDQDVWLTSSGEEYTIDDIKRHIMNILDGNFSLQNIPDSAFFEEKIVTHRDFRKYTYQGLPDIRVIVYNNVPVMAMMRLPTKWSKGKGNLMQGAVGVGIDMATGRTTFAGIKKPVRRQMTEHPDTKQDLKGLAVPYWNEVLEIAIRCQQVTGIGFLGADIAIDEKHGPLILELNARAGLEIQNINMAPLASRLRRVEGLKVDSVEKGVRLAKELFGGGSEKKVDELISKPVIGTRETIEVITPDGTRRRVFARMDTGAGLSSIDAALARKLDLEVTKESVGVKSALGKEKRGLVNLKFSLAGEKIETQATTTDRSSLKNPIIIGRRDLDKFIIDPGRKVRVSESKKADYKKIDETLVDTKAKLPMLAYLTPANLTEEKTKFFNQENYSPQFRYNKPTNSELDLYRQRLEKIKLTGDNSVLSRIFSSKKEELLKIIEVIKAIGTPEITDKAIKLFGQPSDELIEYAEKNYRQKKVKISKQDFLKEKDIIAYIKLALDKTSIPYKIVLVPDLTARMKVTPTADMILINVRQGVKFKKSDLLGTIAHEIETHAYRYANGIRQPYKIFAIGLANYLGTEEGLAIYNKERIYENPRKYITRCLKAMALNKALTSSFREVYDYLRKKGVLPKTAFNITYRAKYGLADTSRGGGFTMGYLYLKGFLDILDYIDKGGDVSKLYIGKVGIKDLPAIEKLSNLKQPKYLPEWVKN